MDELERDAGRGSAEPLEPLLFAERVRLLYARSAFVAIVLTSCALMLTAVLRPAVPGPAPLAWTAMVAVVAALRMVLAVVYRARPRPPGQARRWAWAYVAASAVHGAVWGAAPFVFAAARDPAEQAFETFLLAGLAAGSAATNFTYLPAFFAFAVPVAAPLAIHLAAGAQRVPLAMSAMVVLYIAAMAVTATSAGRAIIGSVRLRLANEAWTEHYRREVEEHRRDAEQLRESEALFRDLTERAVVGVYVLQDGLIVYANPRMADIFGYPPDELVGRTSNLDLTHPDDRPLVLEQIRNWLSGDLASLHYASRGLRKDGAVVDVEVFGTRTTYRGQPAVIGTLVDVTDRNKAERELIRVQKLESLGVLAGGIAHDFNNLLAVILGDLSLAREQTPRGEVREALLEGEAAALRARDLARQLLTFSRGGEPIKKRVALASVVRSAAAFALRGTPVMLEDAIADDLWPVDADEGQLAQVVQNLVLNAVQAMPHGGRVGVAAVNRAATRPDGTGEDRFVRLSVSDTGAGIPPELLGKVFDPYFTTKEKGTGLGLATVHSIVARHGGHVEVQSEPGRGATFHVDLPAAERTGAPEPPRSASVVPGHGRVAVMDDDGLLRRAVGRMLSRLGFEAVPARDGDELLEVCARAREEGRPIAAAIMDLTVPGGMGGKDAVRLLREREPGVRPIVSSGYSGDPIMAEYDRYGFAGVVAKPYRLEELSEVLTRVLGQGPP